MRLRYAARPPMELSRNGDGRNPFHPRKTVMIAP